MFSDQPAAIATAIDTLLAGDFQDRWQVAKQFSEIGVAALPALLELMQDEALDWEVRWFVTRILGNFESSTAIEALIQLLLHSDDDDLRQMAAAALAQIGVAAVTALAPLLQYPVQRPLVVQALARIPHRAVIPLLMQVVRDEQASVRATAMAALGHFSQPDLLPVLMMALDDREATVRAEAVRGLGRWSATQMQPAHIARLAQGLTDVDDNVAQLTANTLGRLGTPPAITALITALQGPPPPVHRQVALVRSLMRCLTEGGLSCLMERWTTLALPAQAEIISGLNHLEDRALQEQAAMTLCHYLRVGIVPAPLWPHLILTLGYLRHPDALPLLQQLLQDDDPRVRMHASEALRQLNSQGSSSAPEAP
ncbi:PBS lyase [Halomicronema hongdechloris C2206]|uniref:PBS lyase n=2 Tax=Halomicronema hongdechloris TaxID=1209493 RepID=A0A1Z3HPD1_9CYAN|nr:PBS lyase [Halomicronema hongdechloris C2206]